VNHLKFAIALASSLFTFSMGSSASAQKVNQPKNTDPRWSQSYTPFRIAGNLYYVGSYDLACYLIVTLQGSILVNTGLAHSEEMIKANVAALGFKFEDIKILLTTQAHFDHMGGMAAMKRLTGAVFMVDAGDSAVASDGGSSDYAFGGHGSTYEPVKPDRLLHNGDSITLGAFHMTVLHHPGHTKGSCSYLFNVKDEQRSYKVLIANMPSIVTEKRFPDLLSYPTIANDYAKTLEVMKKLSFDIWLSSHASQFNLHGKHKPSDAYNPHAFFDDKGYRDSLADLEDQFVKKQK